MREGAELVRTFVGLRLPVHDESNQFETVA